MSRYEFIMFIVAMKPMLYQADKPIPIAVRIPMLPLKLSEEESAGSTPSAKPNIAPKPRQPLTPKVLKSTKQFSLPSTPVSIPVTHLSSEQVDVDLELGDKASQSLHNKVSSHDGSRFINAQNISVAHCSSTKSIKRSTDNVTPVFKVSFRKTMDVPLIQEHIVEITKTNDITSSTGSVFQTSSIDIVDIGDNNISDKSLFFMDGYTVNSTTDESLRLGEVEKRDVFIARSHAATFPADSDMKLITSVLRSQSLSHGLEQMSRFAFVQYDSETSSDESGGGSDDVNNIDGVPQPTKHTREDSTPLKSEISGDGVVEDPIPLPQSKRMLKKHLFEKTKRSPNCVSSPKKYGNVVRRNHSDPVDRRYQIKKILSKDAERGSKNKSIISKNTAKQRKKSITDIISFSRIWKANKSDLEQGGKSSQFYTESESDKETSKKMFTGVSNTWFYNRDESSGPEAEHGVLESDHEDKHKCDNRVKRRRNISNRVSKTIFPMF